MATAQTRTLSRLMLAPSVVMLLAWMAIPLAMTLYFSFQRYNLLNPSRRRFAGWFNYEFFVTDPAFFAALTNTRHILAHHGITRLGHPRNVVAPPFGLES